MLFVNTTIVFSEFSLKTFFLVIPGYHYYFGLKVFLCFASKELIFRNASRF